jgi:hypothetical protein
MLRRQPYEERPSALRSDEFLGREFRAPAFIALFPHLSGMRAEREERKGREERKTRKGDGT